MRPVEHPIGSHTRNCPECQQVTSEFPDPSNVNSRIKTAVVARAKRARKILLRPLERGVSRGRRFVRREAKKGRATWKKAKWAAIHSSRFWLAEVGATVLPPLQCPGCGSWRQVRRLASCSGAVGASPLRQRPYATGCPTCGLLYVSPRPPAAHFVSLYGEEGEWAATHQRESTLTVSARLAALVDQATGFKSPAPDSQVLDFGCGHGRWLNTFAAAGWKTYGIDPSLKSAFERHTELTEIGCEERFSFVILSHVLEHVTNPGEILRALGRATRRGGWIYLAVPGLDGLPDHRDWQYMLSATHVAAFSLACLTELLARAGFERPIVIHVPRDAKAPFRLRLIARKGEPGPRLITPLEPALTALRGAGLLRAAAGRVGQTGR